MVNHLCEGGGKKGKSCNQLLKKKHNPLGSGEIAKEMFKGGGRALRADGHNGEKGGGKKGLLAPKNSFGPDPARN